MYGLKGKIFLCSLLALFFSGCTYIQPDVEQLMTPPAMTQEQSAIYAALEEAAGNDIGLVYPKSGKNRSAFLFTDLDGDGEEEAVAFYEHQNTAGNVRINLLDKREGGWVSLSDTAGYSNEISMVDLALIGVRREKMLLVGYETFNRAGKTLLIYSFEDGGLKEEYSEEYSAAIVVDIDRDKRDEVVLFHTGDHYSEASAKYIKGIESGIREFSEIELSGEATEYVNIAFGRFSEEDYGVFADGRTADGEYFTEVLTYESGELVNKTYVDLIDYTVQTERFEPIYCLDINGDGVLEIPFQIPAIGYDGMELSETIFLTQWGVMEEEGIVSAAVSLVDLRQGYILLLPDEWSDYITIRKDEELGEYIFYQYTGLLEDDSGEVLRLRSVKKNDQRFTNEMAEYQKIAARGLYDYYAVIPDSENYPITIEQVKENFLLID